MPRRPAAARNPEVEITGRYQSGLCIDTEGSDGAHSYQYRECRDARANAASPNSCLRALMH